MDIIIYKDQLLSLSDVLRESREVIEKATR